MVRAGADGYVKAVTGGDPMRLSGDITLCARSDLDSQVSGLACKLLEC